jgi:ABC-type dipeptide/oligopeptide/nickel transport system ATPase component
VTPLLALEHLTVGFRTERGFARVVDDLSLRIEAGRIVGLVGESGGDKSLTAPNRAMSKQGTIVMPLMLWLDHLAVRSGAPS